MLHFLVGMTLLLTAADHWTTYLCLRSPVAGWQVSEGNPLADWLFGSLGLVNGILLDSLLTLAAVTFLVRTPLVPHSMKQGFFIFVVLWTGWAVSNNLTALQALGLSPWGPA